MRGGRRDQVVPAGQDLEKFSRAVVVPGTVRERRWGFLCGFLSHLLHNQFFLRKWSLGTWVQCLPGSRQVGSPHL